MTVTDTGSPTLRFPQFEGDWKASRGGEAFRQRRERGEDGLPLYSVTIERGIVPRDSLDREISSAMQDEGNLRVRKDDLAYNMMRMWQGAVGRAAVTVLGPARPDRQPLLRAGPGRQEPEQRCRDDRPHDPPRRRAHLRQDRTPRQARVDKPARDLP